MTTRQFDPLILDPIFNWTENCELEFKSAKGDLPNSLWETYSAFANTDGGIILLEVEKDGNVSGVDKSSLEKLRTNFWSLVNNRGKISINLLVEKDVKEISHQSKTILAIQVPRASRYQRPVYFGQNPLIGTYKRNHEGDYHCSDQEVTRMLSDTSQEQSADFKIVKGFTIEDLDRKSLREYRNRFASIKPDHVWLNEDEKGFLTKIGGWRRDKNDGLEGITLAAILMFGTDESIREAAPQYQVNYYEKLSLDPQVRWTDRITMDGTWNANLFQFYLATSQRLFKDLKLPFQLDENLIRKGETPVHQAIREALVNSIIHADYYGQGGVIIEKKHDRFEFSNPGSLLIPRSQLLGQESRSNVSECRNKILQQMFTSIGAAEKAGSGIDKIYFGWESQHWRKPAITEDFKPDRVRCLLTTISLIPEESLVRLKALFGSKFQKLDTLEVQALVAADVEGYVDKARMCQIVNLHAADVTKLLQSLVSQGLLSQENKNRWARYRLHSLHKENHSVHNDNHSVHNENHSVHNFTKEAWEILKKIASPTLAKGRLNSDVMEEIIKKLCEDRWLTRREISDLVNRHPDSVRTRFLTPMVKHGILRLRHPNSPNRVDQAYQTNTPTT